jgi:hypothetical protein
VGGPASSYLGSLVTVVVTVKDACSQVSAPRWTAAS